MVELVAQSGNVDDSLRLRGVESHRGKGHYAAKAIKRAIVECFGIDG